MELILIITKRLAPTLHHPFRIRAIAEDSQALVSDYNPNLPELEQHRRAAQSWLDRWQLEGRMVSSMWRGCGYHHAYVEDARLIPGAATRERALIRERGR